MTKPLLVVESPTKVKTLQKYLGQSYRIAATVGHIKDLPDKEMGINIEKQFKPHYRIIPGKRKVISNLKRAAGDAQEVYLAPDPDREGEAIAWHTAEILKAKDRRFYRVLFHELTQNAIKEAMASPSDLNEDKYEAQQTRRILDRLVGYQISPLLWRKVKGGLSAGRVQSVALRIICERERAIQAFESEEYWSITAHLKRTEPPSFTAKLAKKGPDKISIPNEKTANSILQDLAQAEFVVQQVVRKTKKRNPLPPFITSKLQQEAIRKLRFSARKTMMIAQQLYEGIEVAGGEPVGLITYMRTDSTRIAKEAAQEALVFIREAYGDRYAMDRPRFFKNKKKAQDAHEAIRPTAVANTPEKMASYLTPDQRKLYSLIWNRFVASQMQPALIDTIRVTIQAGSYQFNASGSTVKFPGFIHVYRSVEEELHDQKKSAALPELSEGARLTLEELVPKQHFTQPPPRFSEASLVKELEENGIGRPSTYASILTTIRQKGYVEMRRGYFCPSELGLIVNDLLVQNFPRVFDVEFTAKMEDTLDRIESAELDATEILSRFYTNFKKSLDAASDGMLSVKGVGIPTELPCPECSRTLHIKVGKNGHFLACSGYPECTYSRDYTRDEKGRVHPVEIAEEEVSDKTCPECESPMVVKQGRYGKFLACSRYPDCKSTQSLNANGSEVDTGVACPENGCDGRIVERTSRRGKVFYGCNRFPKCKFAIWDKPVAEACPQCAAPFLVQKTTKKTGPMLKCRQPECGYQRELDDAT